MRRWTALAIFALVGVLSANAVNGFPDSSPMRDKGVPTDAVVDWMTVKAVFGPGDPTDSIGTLDELYFGVDDWAPPSSHPRTPGALLLQLPLGLGDAADAQSVMVTVVVVSVTFLAYAAVRLGMPWWAVLPLAGVWFLKPVVDAFKAGSQGPLIAALIAVTWVMADEWKGGIGLGLASVFKLFPLVLIPVLWVNGYRKTAYGAVGAFGVVNLVGWLVPGVTFDPSVFVVPAEVATNPGNLADPVLRIAGVVILFWLLTRRMSKGTVLAVGSVVMLMLSPIIWWHYLAVLILPVLWVGLRHRRGDAAAYEVEITRRVGARVGLE